MVNTTTIEVRRDYLSISFVAIAILISYYCFKSISHPIHDFANYYFAGKFFVEGSFDQTIYDPTTFNLKLSEQGYQGFFVNFSPNSPFIALFFFPLASLDIQLAKLLFNFLNGFFFLFSFVRIVRLLKIQNEVSLLLIPFICFIPIRNGILFGQFYMLLFSMIIEGYILYKKGKIAPAMLLWVISASLKITPGIVLFYLLGRRDYRAIGIFCIWGAVSLCLTGLLLDFDIFRFYVEQISPKVSAGEIVSAGFLANQSPLMFFKHLFIADSSENPSPFIESGILFAFFMAATFIVAFYCTFYSSGKCKGDEDFKMLGLWLLLIFLISPYGSSYSRILLVIVYFSIVQNESLLKQIAVGLLLLGITNFPALDLPHWPLVLRFAGLFATIAVFLLVTPVKVIRANHLIPLTLLLTTFIYYFYRIPKERQTASDYLMLENPSLIVDYEVQDGAIRYNYWHGEMHEGTVALSGKRYDSSQVSIIGDGLYLRGEQLIKSSDNKKRPLLVDNDKVVYLSDWGRGYGFYTFRIIRLDK